MMNRVLKALHWSDQKSWDVDGNLVIVKVLKLIVIKSLRVSMKSVLYLAITSTMKQNIYKLIVTRSVEKKNYQFGVRILLHQRFSYYNFWLYNY